jgi:hypothetical protein
VIAGYNWCKIVHENTREAGRKWKLARQLSITKPIQGCSLFLMVMYIDFFVLQVITTHTHTHLTVFLVQTSQILYLDNLKTNTAIDPLCTPRCALYTSELIRNLQHGDERRVGTGPSRYGKCKVTHTYMTYIFHFQLMNICFYICTSAFLRCNQTKLYSLQHITYIIFPHCLIYAYVLHHIMSLYISIKLNMMYLILHAA